MKLNRREFLRATGLAGLLTTFGIELPEIEAAEALPIITEAVVSPDCGIEISVQAPRLPLVDLSSLRNVSIEAYRPTSMAYRYDDDLAKLFYSGSPEWIVSVLARKSEIHDIGLSLEDICRLMTAERRYRFTTPHRGRCFEGIGAMTYCRFDDGFFPNEETITMSIKGAEYSWRACEC